MTYIKRYYIDISQLFIVEQNLVGIDTVVSAVRLSLLRNTQDAHRAHCVKYDVIHKTGNT